MPIYNSAKRHDGETGARAPEASIDEKVRGSSVVFSLVLLGLICAHLCAFLVMSVYTLRRLDNMDVKVAGTQQESDSNRQKLESLYQLTQAIATNDRGPVDDVAGRIAPPVHRGRRQALEVVGTSEQLQHVASPLTCRQEIGDVLKHLIDTIMRTSDESVRKSLRMRVNQWTEKQSKVAEDRSKRQAAGDELEGIFDEIANAELAIFERYCGNASKICLPGDKGEPGAKGELGLQGNIGPKGEQGALGPVGPKGEIGARGEKGDIGASGPPGPKGSPGVDGTPGVDGAQGAKGNQGDRGDTGITGSTGSKGEPGEKGSIGSSGPPGPKGADGLAGYPGIRGPQGEVGPQGAKGEIGVPGIQGPQGVPGVAGQAGPKGNIGEKGELGAQGPVGASGPPGPKGSPGIDGMPGLVGARGEKGEMGQTGSTGPQGAVGAKGDIGPQGLSGADGQKGERGQAGFSGPPGPKGSSGYPGVPGGMGQKGEPGVWRPGMESCCTSLSKPAFSSSPQSVTVNEDQPLRLSCGTSAFPPATVTWEPPNLLSDPRVRLEGQDLVINDTTFTDSGEITCSATNALGTSKKVFNIDVVESAVVTQGPSDTNVTEGEPLHLQCTFTGQPLPTIHWYHVNSEGNRALVTSGVTQTGGVSELNIPDTRVSDRGSYECVGTIGTASASASSDVTVFSKPYITSTSGPNVVTVTGTDLILQCISNSLPTPVISWTHNRNDSHVYEDANGDLHIVDVRKLDSGPYICTATNALGQDSKEIEVQVQAPPTAEVHPEFTNLKPQLFFNCIVEGDEPLQVTWTREGVPLDLSNRAKYIEIPNDGTGAHRLLLMAVTDADVGRYDCAASNAYGNQRDTTVVYKDMQTVQCSDTFAMCDVNICGAHCPADCVGGTGAVFGTTTYTEYLRTTILNIKAGLESGFVNMPVCCARWHSGALSCRHCGVDKLAKLLAFCCKPAKRHPVSGNGRTGFQLWRIFQLKCIQADNGIYVSTNSNSPVSKLSLQPSFNIHFRHNVKVVRDQRMDGRTSSNDRGDYKRREIHHKRPYSVLQTMGMVQYSAIQQKIKAFVMFSPDSRTILFDYPAGFQYTETIDDLGKATCKRTVLKGPFVEQCIPDNHTISVDPHTSFGAGVYMTSGWEAQGMLAGDLTYHLTMSANNLPMFEEMYGSKDGVPFFQNSFFFNASKVSFTPSAFALPSSCREL